VAATNKALEVEIAEGRFREDLYYRLNVVPINVPPLRARREDIPALVNKFVGALAKNSGFKAKPFEADALEAMAARDWPGNVRELRNAVERLVILATGDSITVADVSRLTGITQDTTLGNLMMCETFDAFKQDAERAFLQGKLSENEWNVSETARKLEMPRSNLYKKIEKYGLERG
jgi:two-component system nitrogen regulation response regulator NtrX